MATKRRRFGLLRRSIGPAAAVWMAFAGGAAATEERPLRLFLGVDEDRLPPYTPHDGRDGVTFEIVRAIIREAGLAFELVSASTIRGRRMLDTGAVDVEPAARDWFKDPDAHGVAWSAPFMHYDDYLIGGPETDFSFFEGFASMRYATVFSVVGYGYPGSDFWGSRVDLRSEEIMVRRLSARIDEDAVGVCNRLACAYWAERLAAPITFGPLYDSADVGLRIAAPRTHLKPRLDAAIARLKASEALNGIIARYAPLSALALPDGE